MADTRFDPNSPAAIAARERESLVRPSAEKTCAQYTRGLLTHDELVCELSELWGMTDEDLRARNARMAARL